MSTYVYISRRSDPLDDTGPSIAAESWLQYVDSEPDFRTPERSEAEWLGPYARILSNYSIPFAFDWANGQVEVKNPDAPTIARMKQLAAKFSSSVFSETGELFDDSGTHAGFLPGFP